MGEPAFKTHYSVEDYLELQSQVDYKIAYHEGEIFEMAGGTVNHARLSARAVSLLDQALRNRKCAVFSSDLMIGYNSRNYVYADASVICGKSETYKENKNAAKNVCLIVEVLSDETADYDRGEKFKKYQNIDTFVEYVLISQHKVWVDVFFKKQGYDFWQYYSYNSLEENIELRSLEITISMQELYDGIF
jgi:Uma2 family endonuclease